LHRVNSVRRADYANRSGKHALKADWAHLSEQEQVLASGSYHVRQIDFAEEWHDLFVTVLYERSFDDDVLWSSLGFSLSRSLFHANFVKDNDEFVCPYCDLTANFSSTGVIIEHFLPKSRFPCLAMHPLNLFEACTGCNGPAGKGDRVLLPISSPYQEEIGSLVTFSFQNRSIRIASRQGEVPVENYISLLKLDSRYAEQRVFGALDCILDGLIDSLDRTRVDWSTVAAYLERFRRVKPLYYATKAQIELWHRLSAQGKPL
jgi:hypothetical protein